MQWGTNGVEADTEYERRAGFILKICFQLSITIYGAAENLSSDNTLVTSHTLYTVTTGYGQGILTDISARNLR